MDMYSENWENTPPLPDAEAELKKIRKDIRKRNWKIVLTSLVLAAAILIGTVQFAIPAAEKLYWNPETYTYSDNCTDLTAAMAAYAELFCPDQRVINVYSSRNGFASYDLTVAMYDDSNFRGNTNYQAASLERGNLTFPIGFWETTPTDVFAQDVEPFFDYGDDFNSITLEKLSQLPDFIQVRAAVIFPEDLDIAQLIDLRSELRGIGGVVDWVGIRISEEEATSSPLCGMKPYGGQVISDEINEEYPFFRITTGFRYPYVIEQHFKSLLQLSIDQINASTGLLPENCDNASYYSDALAYVEENGVYTYGCYLVGSAQMFLDLIDSGTICRVYLEDAWISL